ncbi:hypothetical protein B9Z55_006253 [Caenorhabditis nigoni]|uniref:Uncharacterized protein n=1 Tax=Caenorhabditis nigoni TaxID=1611254 RepID=A0A2G5V4F0_9PELO|nr:hypothetical protein B9Z55_006253 [Caenorhabditis nigoni]
MTNQLSIILFFVLLIATCASAINCYYGIDETAGTVHVSNVVKTQCPFDFFCFNNQHAPKRKMDSKHVVVRRITVTLGHCISLVS